MRKTLEVVDGFHPNPAALTSRALDAPVITDGEPAAPGRGRLVGPCHVDPWASATVSSLLGTRADRTVPPPDGGRFVLRNKDVPGDDAPHREPTDWTAIVFLSAAPPPGAGLTFLLQQPGGPGDWVECAFIPVRFNRLVLYRSSVLSRRASPGFGTGLADGWLSHEWGFDIVPLPERTAHAL
ncbi:MULTISPECIES: hypothetical protein [Streptomyces]|uniref:Uncharacterized protein n=1 Tax=Streptomyces fradiae ATCC 10745 = DSM 40063 TaxID=1319510 RepID=A0A1Y2NUM5_STRFR|nr:MULTISPECIES: hypothetical protein [Streptomyces]KAF0646846.1 hypothetical protein K701_26475 [Streptomyces fradiae ATCC 10745 = DSM 40063]OSY51205.1 hypothetical protein BG846_03187 [Streptomyces fradiae ATCC 10745 = DSM 40063]QEV10673.1 hypothetical protein CP974_00030 [Streptomyces fradiae ATCC 10745 = DSM 40063]